MKRTLNELNTWLEEDSKNLISIYEQTGQTRIIKNANAQYFKEKYSGFFSYLERLYRDGATSVHIQTGRARGEASHNWSATREYVLTKNPIEETKTEKEKNHVDDNGGFYGLSGQDYVRSIEEKLARKTKKVKRLKKELKEYNKPSQGLSGELIKETLADKEVMGGIATILKVLKPSPKPEQPAQPQPVLDVSPKKGYLINAIKNPDLNDDDVTIIYSVLERIQKDQDFKSFLIDLLNEKQAV